MDWQVNAADNKPEGKVAVWIPKLDGWCKASWYDYAGSKFWMSPMHRVIASDDEVSHWAYVEGPGA